MEYAKDTTSIEELESRLEIQQAQLNDLATMGSVVTSILDIDAVLSVTMDMAVRLVDGEVGLILLEEKGELRSKVSWGVSDQFVKSLKYKSGVDLATYCYQEKQTIVLTDLGIRSPEGIALESVIASPIQSREHTLGVMVIINKVNNGGFTKDDDENLSRLLNFVAVAVENSILVNEKLTQQKIDQEMAIARQIQETILPQDFDNIDGINVGAVYFPAREVGGDFYELLKVDDGRVVAVIGDVSNKGVPAALVMSACSAIIKTTLTSDPSMSVSSLAEKVNDLMSEQIIRDREMYVTLFFCCFDIRNQQLAWCNAGHVPGLFWSHELQKVQELTEGGPILGQFAGVNYIEGRCKIVTGDSLFLFTDGLTEAVDKRGVLFGRDRAEQVFATEIGLPPKEFCQRVKEWVDRFAEGAPEETHDDFTVLQIRVG